MYTGGYHRLVWILSPPALMALWYLRRQALCGATVGWQRGVWFIEKDDCHRTVHLLPQSCCLPWVIYLAWREVSGGRLGHLWLFADSADACELRCLRVRLTLQR
jgi:hypothetical protein